MKRARASGDSGPKICHCWVALFNVMVRFSNIRDTFSETKKPAGRISNILCSHKWCWSITQNIWTMPRARNTEKEHKVLGHSMVPFPRWRYNSIRCLHLLQHGAGILPSDRGDRSTDDRRATRGDREKQEEVNVQWQRVGEKRI